MIVNILNTNFDLSNEKEKGKLIDLIDMCSSGNTIRNIAKDLIKEITKQK